MSRLLNKLKKELQSFREPVPLGFGDIAERREGGLAGVIAGAGEETWCRSS